MKDFLVRKVTGLGKMLDLYVVRWGDVDNSEYHDQLVILICL